MSYSARCRFSERCEIRHISFKKRHITAHDIGASTHPRGTRGPLRTRFDTDGRLEADNNIAENAMRGIALGRKNYLFAGSDAGGDRAAAMYTIVQTAKLNGVNQEVYLRNTLAKIAEGHPINRKSELMLWNTEMTDIHQTERELD